MNRDKAGKFLNGHISFRNKSKPCKLEDCKNISKCLGFCSRHYQRYKKFGDPNAPFRKIGQPKNGQNLPCLKCYQNFYRPLSAIKRGDAKFCSRECAFLFQKGKQKNIKPIESRRWYLNPKGYVQTTIRRQRIYQHRWVMEQEIGRKLTNSEFVHHINGNKQDNSIENLVLVTKENHSREHQSVIKKLEVAIGLLRFVIKNDPSNLNVNWLNNVRYYMEVGK